MPFDAPAMVWPVTSEMRQYCRAVPDMGHAAGQNNEVSLKVLVKFPISVFWQRKHELSFLFLTSS